jgi:hypothetical protein
LAYFARSAKGQPRLPVLVGASGVSPWDEEWERQGRTVVGRWVRIDRRYNQLYRLTTYASHAIFKWIGLFLAWVFVNTVLTAIHLGALVLVTTGGLIWYAIHCAQRNRRTQLAEPAYRPVVPAANQQQVSTPPNWYAPPVGWSPEPGRQPDPSWPLASAGWQGWAPAPPPTRGAPGERNSRVIPQDVKIAVASRDQGKCVQCGSAENLHYDHKIPYSRGGSNTVNNIQLLCGRCNRRRRHSGVIVPPDNSTSAGKPRALLHWH